MWEPEPAQRAGTLAEANALAYGMAERIDWPSAHYRRDIGLRALAPVA